MSQNIRIIQLFFSLILISAAVIFVMYLSNDYTWFWETKEEDTNTNENSSSEETEETEETDDQEIDNNDENVDDETDDSNNTNTPILNTNLERGASCTESSECADPFSCIDGVCDENSCCVGTTLCSVNSIWSGISSAGKATIQFDMSESDNHGRMKSEWNGSFISIEYEDSDTNHVQSSFNVKFDMVSNVLKGSIRPTQFPNACFAVLQDTVDAPLQLVPCDTNDMGYQFCVEHDEDYATSGSQDWTFVDVPSPDTCDGPTGYFYIKNIAHDRYLKKLGSNIVLTNDVNQAFAFKVKQCSVCEDVDMEGRDWENQLNKAGGPASTTWSYSGSDKSDLFTIQSDDGSVYLIAKIENADPNRGVLLDTLPCADEPPAHALFYEHNNMIYNVLFPDYPMGESPFADAPALIRSGSGLTFSMIDGALSIGNRKVTWKTDSMNPHIEGQLRDKVKSTFGKCAHLVDDIDDVLDQFENVVCSQSFTSNVKEVSSVSNDYGEVQMDAVPLSTSNSSSCPSSSSLVGLKFMDDVESGYDYSMGKSKVSLLCRHEDRILNTDVETYTVTNNIVDVHHRGRVPVGLLVNDDGNFTSVDVLPILNTGKTVESRWNSDIRIDPIVDDTFFLCPPGTICSNIELDLDDVRNTRLSCRTLLDE